MTIRVQQLMPIYNLLRRSYRYESQPKETYT
ncbi:hypothetical protein EXIGUO8A_260008 [Exiguobacterium sp. 8A]|nr:hypothetical protein EXIGUO8A_260008 [Exiguobacterium sp. 8A]